MEMYHCGERIYVLPENAVCKADEYKRNPLDIDNCPLGMKYVQEIAINMMR